MDHFISLNGSFYQFKQFGEASFNETAKTLHDVVFRIDYCNNLPTNYVKVYKRCIHSGPKYENSELSNNLTWKLKATKLRSYAEIICRNSVDQNGKCLMQNYANTSSSLLSVHNRGAVRAYIRTHREITLIAFQYYCVRTPAKIIIIDEFPLRCGVIKLEDTSGVFSV